MAFQYERYGNDIEVAEDNLSSGSEDENHTNAATTYVMSPSDRRKAYFHEKWPHRIGLLHAALGFTTLILGTIQVILLPSIYDPTLQSLGLHKNNCYGIGVWTGTLLVLTGSFGLRSWWYRNATMVYVFFSFVLLEILALIAGIVIILLGYSQNWTTKAAYHGLPHLFGIHIGVSLCVVLGMVLAALAFTQYYEAVFFGELQLCRHFIHCLLPCLCPRVITQEELLEETNQRPPSLPI